MLGQFVKWAALAAVWTKVKPVFWGTLATVLFTVAVSAVHGEFVEFLRIDQELSGASAPLASQVRVWLVFSYLGKFRADSLKHGRLAVLPKAQRVLRQRQADPSGR
jgi:ABC-type uncharacterized transport system permease subunit